MPAPDVPAAPAPEWIRDLRANLLCFFDEHAREMPWRETSDPYAIWVSEVMLQQTRVETVVPYFQRWLEAFPTADALAAAEQETVLKHWEGLGYYSRARNLHRAAQVIREEHAGQLPRTVSGLRSLPGVGPYTAGAVGSIAFGLRAPAVDGNVRRVAARLLDWPDPGGKALETTVAEWVPGDRPGDFNQALMELGATVCTPKNPGCYICPVAELCAARAAGTVGERPVPKKRGSVRREVHAVQILARRRSSASSDPVQRAEAPGGRPGLWEVAMQQRPAQGLLAGMWEFPGTPVPDEATARELMRGGAAGRLVAQLDPVPHAFTHLHVTYVPNLMARDVDQEDPVHALGNRPVADSRASGDSGLRWLTREEVEALPLPVAQQKIAVAAFRTLEDQQSREDHGGP